MRHVHRIVVALTLILGLAGCASRSAPAAIAPPAARWPAEYQAAIEDARNPTPAKVVQNLVAIVPTNPMLVWKQFDDGPRVLMVTLVGTPSRYQPSLGRAMTSRADDVVWVTAVPELRNLCAQTGFSRGDLAKRLRQLIGLTPETTVTAFVELWVSPSDLRRPAPDNEITDATAGLNIPDDAEPWYRRWFNDTRASQYADSKDPPRNGYPWTQLGYTYDWGGAPPLHQGVSEFVIRPASTVIVNTITEPQVYCQRN